MKKLLIFNWKSNPRDAASAIKLARATEKFVSQKNVFKVVIAPPFPFLESVGKIVKKAKLGAQDAFWEDVGSYTGEVSWHQEKNLKVKYVIVGHSERRRFLGETDEMINKKVLAALKAGLKAVLCVGENLTIRRRGKKAVENFIKNQLKKDLKGIKKLPVVGRKSLIGNFLIAYEPIWAIGNKHSDTPEDAAEMIRFIKNLLATRYSLNSIKILYGGSVDSKNIAKFLKEREIDGALVGHSSLKAPEIQALLTNLNFKV